MAYDEGLAERIRAILEDCGRVSERRMFGGLAFLMRGNMTVGIVKDELMVRVGPETYAQVLREPHARAMDFTGRPMKGFVFVSPEGLESDTDLERWVARGVAYGASLPAKEPRLNMMPPNKRMRLARSARARRRGPRRLSAVLCSPQAGAARGACLPCISARPSQHTPTTSAKP